MLEASTEGTARRDVVLDARMGRVIHAMVTAPAEATGSRRLVKVNPAIVK